ETTPTSRASFALSNSIPPGPSEPSSIPSPRKATRTGSPVFAAPKATPTLAARTAPTASIERPRFTQASLVGGPGGTHADRAKPFSLHHLATGGTVAVTPRETPRCCTCLRRPRRLGGPRAR